MSKITRSVVFALVLISFVLAACGSQPENTPWVESENTILLTDTPTAERTNTPVSTTCVPMIWEHQGRCSDSLIVVIHIKEKIVLAQVTLIERTAVNLNIQEVDVNNQLVEFLGCFLDNASVVNPGRNEITSNSAQTSYKKLSCNIDGGDKLIGTLVIPITSPLGATLTAEPTITLTPTVTQKPFEIGLDGVTFGEPQSVFADDPNSNGYGSVAFWSDKLIVLSSSSEKVAAGYGTGALVYSELITGFNHCVINITGVDAYLAPCYVHEFNGTPTSFVAPKLINAHQFATNRVDSETFYTKFISTETPEPTATP